MKIKRKKIKKKAEVMEWILLHPRQFFLICGVGAERMTDEKYKKLWNFLRKREFEVLFAVLITIHHEKIGIDIE